MWKIALRSTIFKNSKFLFYIYLRQIEIPIYPKAHVSTCKGGWAKLRYVESKSGGNGYSSHILKNKMHGKTFMI